MTTNCKRCGRPYARTRDVIRYGARAKSCITRAVVEFSDVVGYDCDGTERFRRFCFDHPYDEDHKTWATSFSDHHLPGIPLDWDESQVSEA